MEGREDQVINPQRRRQNSAKCCGLALMWFLSASLGIAFLAVDSLETGQLDYTYSSQWDNHRSMSNKFVCGYNTITIHCSDDYSYDFCWGISSYTMGYDNDYVITRTDVNPSFEQQYANIWFISLCIASCLSYIVTTCIWALAPSSNKKLCGIRQKHKCFILCLLSMIASILGAVLGAHLSDDQSCADGLEDYLVTQIQTWDDRYSWDGPPTTKYGITLYFLMANCGVTFLFVIWSCQCIICPCKDDRDLSLKRMLSKKLTRYSAMEGNDEAPAYSVKRYPSAKVAKMSINAVASEGL